MDTKDDLWFYLACACFKCKGFIFDDDYLSTHSQIAACTWTRCCLYPIHDMALKKVKQDRIEEYFIKITEAKWPEKEQSKTIISNMKLEPQAVKLGKEKSSSRYSKASILSSRKSKGSTRKTVQKDLSLQMTL